MQGFKGLVPRQTLTDQAFLTIHKKAQQHRKSAQLCIDFFQQINKFFQSFSAAVEKCVHDSDIQNIKAPYYSLIGFVCTKLLIENKQLTESTKISSRDLTRMCNIILQDFSKYLNQFQANLRKYQENQLIVQELCKKYYRSFKLMLSSIEAYKNSLTDVTLIYNMDEKIKRYQNCETNYKMVTSEFNAICEKAEQLTDRKFKIVKNYDDFKSQFTNVIKKIGSKVIDETKKFVTYYCSTNKSIATFLAEQKYNLSKEALRPFFWDMETFSNPEIFNLALIPQKAGKSSIPMIFQYPDAIKQQFLETYNAQILAYLQVVEQNIEKRKMQNKKVHELFVQYFKVIEKVHIIGVKQIMQNFQKLKKKLVESFGPRLASFLKSINSIFELLSGINQKLVKNINHQLVVIQGLTIEEAKYLKLFNDQLRTNIEKFVGKKEMKKLKEDQFTEQVSVVNITNYRKEVNQKAQFFKHLINGFEEKMSKNCVKISNNYTNLINDLNQAVNQFYSLCCEYQEIYFGSEQFEKNFKIYQNDVDNLIEKNKAFFDDLSLNILKGDTSKITFDGQFSKLDEFKKLKKPVPIQNETKDLVKEQKNSEEPKSPKALSQGQASNNKAESQTKSIESFDVGNSRKSSMRESLTSNDEKQSKYLDFLMSKVQFKENEQFIKSFACALSQKIVLQGRIYITTDRICFHSGFNSSNIFFGATFIQFPKQDITKVEKRLNAIFMDNSISFTTVKGELFFTSFFSRNEAYDLICKTFEINLDEHVYDYNEHEKEQIAPTMIAAQVTEADDINEVEIQTRKNKIDRLLTTFPYGQAVKIDLDKQGLTAFQIFKIFYSNNQIVISKRKYASFLTYIKEVINHKDLQIDPWDTPTETFMNQSNIKSGAPQKITRKIRATVPVANSGVPFMPKTAKSQEVQSLYFYSKHKWILQAEISTTGAPYTDTFKVQLRTGVTSDVTGKCHISIGFYVNFVKSTMMKGVIESKSAEETTKASKVWLDEIKKYFSSLAKSESSNRKKSQNPVSNYKQQIEQKSVQIEQLRNQKQAMQKQIESLRIWKQKSKKIMIGMAALIVVLFLLLIT